MAGSTPWWSEDHEKNFYEAIIVVVLVLLAMIFEDVFHALTHSAEHSYYYGASRDTHQNKEDRAHQHKQPFKELAQHLGTEFMTLGFLACVIFLGNISGFFQFLADIADEAYGGSYDVGYSSGSSYDSSNSSSAGYSLGSSYADDGHRRLAGAADAGMTLLIGPWSMAMPRTAGDFLHLTEEVHIRMFFGMVLYFGIVFSIIGTGVAKIKEWAELTNRKILMEVHKLHDVHDSALTEYNELTKYTIVHMLNWQRTEPERWEKLVMALYEDRDLMPTEEVELMEEVKTQLNMSFSLGHYLASTLEDGVVDIIELHRVTWASLMVLFIFFMFLHQQQVKMVFIAGVILLAGILTMGLTYKHIMKQDRNIENSAHMCVVKEKDKDRGKNSASTLGGGNSSKGDMMSGGLMFNQFVFLRCFETTIFVWCYSYASLIFNKEGWENEFLVSLVEVLLYTIFTFVASSFLPTVVTHLFIQYSLPFDLHVRRARLDEHHFKILIRTIGDDDPALLDLARNGADEIKQAVNKVNARNNTSRVTWDRSRKNTNVSTDGDDYQFPLPSAPVRGKSELNFMPALVATPAVPSALVAAPVVFSPVLLAIPPTPGTLADALSEVLAKPEGLKLVQKMVEEAARVRVANAEKISRPELVDCAERPTITFEEATSSV